MYLYYSLSGVENNGLHSAGKRMASQKSGMGSLLAGGKCEEIPL